MDTWKAMEKLVDLGLVKSIGISNFNSEQVDRLLANCRIKPVNNQVRNSSYVCIFVIKQKFYWNRSRYRHKSIKRIWSNFATTVTLSSQHIVPWAVQFQLRRSQDFCTTRNWGKSPKSTTKRSLKSFFVIWFVQTIELFSINNEFLIISSFLCISDWYRHRSDSEIH